MTTKAVHNVCQKAIESNQITFIKTAPTNEARCTAKHVPSTIRHRHAHTTTTKSAKTHNLICQPATLWRECLFVCVCPSVFACVHAFVYSFI